MNESMLGILYIVGLFALLWFLMIRPQQQRQKKHAEMVRGLNVNNKIVTIGGIYGTIVKVKEDSLVVKIADNVRITILKNAVSQVLPDSNGESDKE
ncbi:preprotein translocase subunit YajC [Desulfotomaculum arcticum]|uniref:Preprotein translocase subunit YajC n=1 Tax=Desulfotruncus arcticus DSM 17038 TaxID=1121424 RepID=A0A1I2SEG2_9FIRM|nr:preprotein translocase subunit YajC [Desulfotruncus arcticus]SFG51100.1 preprotein translocase subunit YajC [Desulfotomaculum arcticum] [Desulfotruncus arcticus DSM 17038]